MKKGLIAILALILGLNVSARETVTTLHQIVDLWEDQSLESYQEQEYTYQGNAAVIMIMPEDILLKDASGYLLLNVSNYQEINYTLGQCVTSFEGKIYDADFVGSNAIGTANLATLQLTDEVTPVEPIIADADKGFTNYLGMYVRFDNVSACSEAWDATAVVELSNGKQAIVMKDSPVMPEIGMTYTYMTCVPMYYDADSTMEIVYCLGLGTPSGIVGIEAESALVKVYDLSGREYVGPQPGFYIIRSGQQTTKVLIK